MGQLRPMGQLRGKGVLPACACEFRRARNCDHWQETLLQEVSKIHAELRELYELPQKLSN